MLFRFSEQRELASSRSGGCVEEAGEEAGDDPLARKLASTGGGGGRKDKEKDREKKKREGVLGCPAKI